MLTVTKRSGKKEAFDVEKLKKSIVAAGEEINEPLNESDINILTSNVLELLHGKETVTSKEVYNILIESMNAQKFNEIAAAYAGFAGNYWI